MWKYCAIDEHLHSETALRGKALSLEAKAWLVPCSCYDNKCSSRADVRPASYFFTAELAFFGAERLTQFRQRPAAPCAHLENIYLTIAPRSGGALTTNRRSPAFSRSSAKETDALRRPFETVYALSALELYGELRSQKTARSPVHIGVVIERTRRKDACPVGLIQQICRIEID